MFAVSLNEQQKLILEEGLRREREKKKRAFKRKKMTHFHNPKLKAILDNMTINFSDILFELPFQCYFSLYLYLLLKNRVKFIDWADMPEHYRIALTQDVNFSKISKEIGVNRTSVRKAYAELVRFRLIEEIDYVKPLHKLTKVCIVFNDYYIQSYDEEAGYVRYSTELPFNFWNKPMKIFY